MGGGALPKLRDAEKHMITVEVLPAGYGDCLLVSCPVPGGTWRLLFDAGPDETWPVLRERLSKIPADAQGRRHIDLAVISHIDHDHIGAARYLFADDLPGLSFGDIWFNGRHHLERGVAEGESLSELLSAPHRDLPWNAAFNGGPVVTPGDGKHIELKAPARHPRITLLSPTPKRLVRLAAVWDSELEKLKRRESNTEAEHERASEFPNLKALAAHKSRKDRSPANGSSIAALLEHGGASVLLAADAFPTVLGSALLGLAKHREITLPLPVDVFKLSHHGSRANLMHELLGVVRAQHYVVSTDNTRFGHPNDETLARVVLYGGAAPVLCFNYATQQNLRWSSQSLQQKHGFTTRFPGKGERGLIVGCIGGRERG
jgi:beta-lactamase superfamily II metal-dependent hydrolase